MNFPFNLSGFMNEAPVMHDGLVPVENSASMRHEVDNVLHPMLEIREHNVVSSDMHVAQLGYQRLGAEAMAIIQKTVAEQMGGAPAEAPSAENITRSQAVQDVLGSSAMQPQPRSAAEIERVESGFWADSPEEQELQRRAGWDGSVSPEIPEHLNAGKLDNYVDQETYFQKDLGLAQAAAAAEQAAQAEAAARANQYTANYFMAKQEVGMEGPQVSAADAQGMYATAIHDSSSAESPEARNAMVEAARVNLHDVHGEIERERVSA